MFVGGYDSSATAAGCLGIGVPKPLFPPAPSPLRPSPPLGDRGPRAPEALLGAKAPDLTRVAPDTGEIVPLFNPRQDAWNDHFRFDGGQIVGLTLTGQATVRLLNMNAPRRVQLREEWLREGGKL